MSALEQLKGKAKEVVADLTGDDALHAEGTAQQDKGVEETKADVASAKAKAHEVKADLAESKQEAAESQR